MMRLLKRLPNGDFELIFFNDDDPPPYAILSHTWIEGQEVTYGELVACTGKDKAGYNKIRFCVDRATEDGLQYCWVDTCCIDKSITNELSTAINSMFRWYQRASKCYVYLSDVQVSDEVINAQAFRITWAEAFRRARWFTRGWTLQELLAPAAVEFFSKEGKRLGSRISLEQEIHGITKIPIEVLRGQSLTELSVEERMSWATNRTTTLKEDIAYCLLGIFGVFLPLIYGEGEAYATLRLREEIQRRQEGRGIETLQDLTVSSPLNFAVTKTALNGQGSGSARLLRPHSGGSTGLPKSSIWSLGSVASESRKDRYYEVPSARKIARFIGQSSILSEIDNKFWTLFSDDDPVPRIVTLVGMGGIGKTQLALEYSKLAYSRKHDTFHDVFWFNASSEETLMTDFMKFSTLLAPPDKPFDGVTERVGFVLSTLNSWKTRLLIVFDNFDDPSFTNVLDYLPSIGACGVLFTSRLREAGDEFGSMIDVPLMNKDDALQVLLSRLRLKDVPEDQSVDCQRVIDLLGSLPLALEQAGAYMASGGGQMSFREFVQHFQTRKKIIMDTTPKFWKYTNISEPKAKSASLSILTTWDLSLDRLGSSSVDRAKKTHFFTVLCFLNPNRISRLFFRSYSKFIHELPAYAQGNDWMSIFKSPAVPFDEDKFRDVVVEMANLSLIRQFAAEILSNNFVVTVHPLIRDWAQFRRSETERKNFAREASYVVAGLLIDYRSPVNLVSFDSMIPIRHGIDDWQYAVFLRDMMTEVHAHMDTCVNHWKAFRMPTFALEDIFVIGLPFANVYSGLGQLDKSYEMFERTHSTTVTNLGEDHETSLKINVQMCSIRILQGRGSEVQTRLEYLVEHCRALKARDIHFNDHTFAQFLLADLYQAQGDIHKATKLAKSLLTSFFLMDINDDLEEKLVIMTSFSNLLNKLDLSEDALMLCRRMIARYRMKTNFSPQSSFASSKELMRMLELSLVGQLLFFHERDGTMETLEEAECLLRCIDESMGDSSTLMDKFGVKAFHGLAFAARGLWPEAIEQTELAYKYSIEVLGPVHPITIGRMNTLMTQLLRSPDNNTDHAVEIVTETLRAATEQLGKSHEKVLALQQQSAALLFNENHRRLALFLLDDLVQKLAEQLAPENPKMVKAQSDLAHYLYLLPDRSEAETQRVILLYRNLIKLEHLEPKSEATIKAQIGMRVRLGLLLYDVEQYPEAMKMYEEALAKQMSLTEKGGTNAWLIQQSIAACYRFQGEPFNALKILKEVEEAQMDVLGSTHEDIASTLHQMGLCYAGLDFEKEPTAYKNGKYCYERVLGIHLTNTNGSLSADAAVVHKLLGDLHRKRGCHMEAAENYKYTCQFSRQKGGEDFFLSLLYLGDELRLAKAWYKQKAVLLERLAWTQEFRGPDSEATMLTIANLATNAECLEELDSSLRYRKEELMLRRKIFEDSPGKTTDCMISISNLSYELGEFETSQLMITEVLRIRSTLDDYDRKDDMRFLADMAMFEVDTKNWEASMVYCRQIIEFYRNDSHELSPYLIYAEVFMGLALYGLENFNDAETHATRSLEMCERLFGEERMSTMKSRLWLAKISFKQENYEKAAQLFDRCIPSLRNLENLSEYWIKYWEQEISCASTLSVSNGEDPPIGMGLGFRTRMIFTATRHPLPSGNVTAATLKHALPIILSAAAGTVDVEAEKSLLIVHC